MKAVVGFQNLDDHIDLHPFGKKMRKLDPDFVVEGTHDSEQPY